MPDPRENVSLQSRAPQDDMSHRISRTVVIDTPGQIDRETMQAICMEEKAYEEKRISTKEFDKKEQEKKDWFNRCLDEAAQAEVEIVRSIFLQMEKIRERREEDIFRERKHVDSPSEIKTQVDSSRSSVLEEKKPLEQQLDFLLQEKERLAEEFQLAANTYQAEWKNALSAQAAVLGKDLEEIAPKLGEKLMQEMKVPPEEAKLFMEKLSDLNQSVQVMFESRPSGLDMVNKQKGAYDAVYDHAKAKGNPEDAAKEVAQVAENKNDLMAQIRAAGLARKRFADEKKAGDKADLKAALAYANGIHKGDAKNAVPDGPMARANKNLHEATRPAAVKAISAKYQLKENAKKIAAVLGEVVEGIPKKNPSAKENKSTEEKKIESTDVPGLEKSARCLAKFIDQSKRVLNAELKAENESKQKFVKG